LPLSFQTATSVEETKMIKIKIVKQTFTTPMGTRNSYGIIINGVPRRVYDTQEEVDAFLGVFNGK